jgi:hypothetical protein
MERATSTIIGPPPRRIPRRERTITYPTLSRMSFLIRDDDETDDRWGSDVRLFAADRIVRTCENAQSRQRQICPRTAALGTAPPGRAAKDNDVAFATQGVRATGAQEWKWCPRPDSNRHALFKLWIFFPPRLSPPPRGGDVRGLEHAFTMALQL